MLGFFFEAEGMPFPIYREMARQSPPYFLMANRRAVAEEVAFASVSIPRRRALGGPATLSPLPSFGLDGLALAPCSLAGRAGGEASSDWDARGRLKPQSHRNSTLY